MVKDRILPLLQSNPGMTIPEMRDALNDGNQHPVSLGAIGKGLADLTAEGRITAKTIGGRFEWQARRTEF